MSVKRINEFWALEDKVSELYEFLVQVQDHIKKSDGCISCHLLQDTEIAEKFLVMEERESKANHKASLASYPIELMKIASEMFARPPIGFFFKED